MQQNPVKFYAKRKISLVIAIKILPLEKFGFVFAMQRL